MKRHSTTTATIPAIRKEYKSLKRWTSKYKFHYTQVYMLLNRTFAYTDATVENSSDRCQEILKRLLQDGFEAELAVDGWNVEVLKKLPSEPIMPLLAMPKSTIELAVEAAEQAWLTLNPDQPELVTQLFEAAPGQNPTACIWLLEGDGNPKLAQVQTDFLETFMPPGVQLHRFYHVILIFTV